MRGAARSRRGAPGAGAREPAVAARAGAGGRTVPLRVNTAGRRRRRRRGRPRARRARGRSELDRDDRTLVGQVGTAKVVGEELGEREVAALAVGHDAGERADLGLGQRVGDEVVDGPEVGRHPHAQAHLPLPGVDDPILALDPDRPGEPGRPARELAGIGQERDHRAGRSGDRDGLRVGALHWTPGLAGWWPGSLRSIGSLARANPMATEQSNHRRTDDAAFPPELLVALDRSSGRGLREQLEGELRPPSAAAGSRSGPRFRPRGSSRATSASPAASSSTPTASSPPRATSRRARARGRGCGDQPHDGRRASPDRRPGTAPGCSAGCRTRRASRARSGCAITARRSASCPCRVRIRTPRHVALRAALAGYLGRVRAVVTTPDLLQICGGFTQGLALVCRALRARGARASRSRTRASLPPRVIANAGLEAVPIPVDGRASTWPRSPRTDVAGVLVAPAHSSRSARSSRRSARARSGVGARERHAGDRGRLRRRVPLRPRPDRRAAGPAARPCRLRGSVSKTLSPMSASDGSRPPALIRDLRREKVYDDLASGRSTRSPSRRSSRGRLRAPPAPRAAGVPAPAGRRLRALATPPPRRDLAGSPPACISTCGSRTTATRPAGLAARRLGVQIEGAARHWAEPEAAPPALVLGYGTAGEAAIEQGVATLGAAYAGVRAPAAAGTAPEGGAQARRWVRSSRAPRAPRAG